MITYFDSDAAVSFAKLMFMYKGCFVLFLMIFCLLFLHFLYLQGLYSNGKSGKI